MLTLIGLVVGGVLVWIGLSVLDGDRGFACLETGCALVGIALFLILPMTCNRMGVGGELVQIAALRSAASRVNLASAEDIFGQVSETNQLIASNQWYRHQWWARDFVASEWDTVTVIPIPTQR